MGEPHADGEDGRGPCGDARGDTGLQRGADGQAELVDGAGRDEVAEQVRPSLAVDPRQSAGGESLDEPLRLVHNFTGTTIGMVHIMLPFMVLPLYATMKTIDQDYMKAAASLGASPVRAFWQIYVPLSFPGLAAGLIVVFVLSLGFYVTPALLGGGRVMMWAMQIERSTTVYADWGAASAMGVVLLVITLGILWLVSRLTGSSKLGEAH